MLIVEAGRLGEWMRDSWAHRFFTWGDGVAQMGQDVVELWATETSSLVALSEGGAGTKKRKGGGRTGQWEAHVLEAGVLPTRSPEPAYVQRSEVLRCYPGQPRTASLWQASQAAVVPRKRKGLPLTSLLKIAMAQKRLQDMIWSSPLSPHRTVMNPECGSEQEPG